MPIQLGQLLQKYGADINAKSGVTPNRKGRRNLRSVNPDYLAEPVIATPPPQWFYL